MSQFRKKLFKILKSALLAWPVVLSSIFGPKQHPPERTDNKTIESDK